LESPKGRWSEALFMRLLIRGLVVVVSASLGRTPMGSTRPMVSPIRETSTCADQGDQSELGQGH
jgi:hypothetical protein